MTAKLYLGDCLEVMRGLADASVDALVTDPPYCSGGFSESAKGGAKSQGLTLDTTWFDGDNMTSAGLIFLLRAMAVEALRVTKPTGHLVAFCDWRMVPLLAPALESAGWRYRSLVVWNKGVAGLGTGFRMQHEMILHMAKRRSTFHATNVGNVLTVKRTSHRSRVHPTEKPVDLIQPLVRVTTPEGGIVLDPFMGSGPTGLACINTGRAFIGIERDPGYFAIAERRINGATEQRLAA